MSVHERLIIETNQSKQLAYLLFFTHGLAIVAVMMISIPFWLVIVAILFLALSLSHHINKTREVVRIVSQPDDEWLIQKSDGTSFNAHLAGDTYISSYLTLLVFISHENASSICVCLLSGSVKSAVLSQLKLRLKISGQLSKVTA